MKNSPPQLTRNAHTYATAQAALIALRDGVAPNLDEIDVDLAIDGLALLLTSLERLERRRRDTQRITNPAFRAALRQSIRAARRYTDMQVEAVRNGR